MMIALQWDRDTKLDPLKTGFACASVAHVGVMISYLASPLLGTSLFAAGVAGMWRSWKSKETGVEPKVILLDMAQAAILHTLLKKIDITALSKLKSGVCTVGVRVGDFLYNEYCVRVLHINRSPDSKKMEDTIYENGAPVLIQNIDCIWK